MTFVLCFFFTLTGMETARARYAHGVGGQKHSNEYNTEEVKKITKIALLCTQASVAMRPTMSEVVVVLLKSKGLLEHMQPSMPIFVESNLKAWGDISASTGSSTTASNATASQATVSTSIVSAR